MIDCKFEIKRNVNLTKKKTFEKNARFLICNKFDFVRFSTNISNKLSIIKYDFWYFDFDVEKINDEINEQIIDAIFNVFDIIFDVKTEKRDDFNAMTEREIISI